MIQTLDMDVVSKQLEDIWAQGFQSIAVVLFHSYTYNIHEAMICRLARQKEFAVSSSAELQPMIKIVARANPASHAAVH